jgi:hypothetical protein
MHFADYFTSFTPDVVPPSRCPLYEQRTMSTHFNSELTRELLRTRQDLDQALYRGFSQRMEDAGYTGGYIHGDPVGVAMMDGPVVIDSFKFTLYGNFLAEEGRQAPAFAQAAMGPDPDADNFVRFTYRTPGNGSPNIPRGNRSLIRFVAPTWPEAPLEVTSEEVVIHGYRYKSWLISLATGILPGHVTTTAAQIEALCEPGGHDFVPEIGNFLSARHGGSGTRVVAATDVIQFSGGEGGLYNAYISKPVPDETGAWDEIWIGDWRGTQISILELDGSHYELGQTVNVLVVNAGIATTISSIVARP